MSEMLKILKEDLIMVSMILCMAKNFEAIRLELSKKRCG
jgi:hypothetical protein